MMPQGATNRAHLSRRGLLGFGAVGVLASAGGVAAHRAFTIEMERARHRLANRSVVIECRFGALEYAMAGQGPPVLMIHGTGGGFDQGIAFARRLAAAGFQVIAPSRFGYLRSAFPPDPSSARQADAFVDLLDALQIERAAIIGGSAGALSALEFAIRHPRRCSALVPIVPATHVPGRAPAAPPSAMAAAIIEYGLQSDLLFWTGLKLAPRSMIRALLATDPDLVERASPEERSRVRAILRDILPVSLRAQGLQNDARLTYNPAPVALEKISAPTLAISLEDDHFGTFAAAQHIASQVRGARLVSYKTGGHVWVSHDEDLFGAVATFLRSNR